MTIEFKKETHDHMIASIKRFFKEELEEDIGDLKALRALEFFTKELGPCVYNKAVSDASKYLMDRAMDVADVKHEPEFGYWKKK